MENKIGFNMIYHSTESDDYLSHLILHGKQKEITMHRKFPTICIKNTNIFLKISVVFFRRGVIKGSERKIRDKAYSTVIVK